MKVCIDASSRDSSRAKGSAVHDGILTDLRPTDRDHADAQRIAFAPLLFEAARMARDVGLVKWNDWRGAYGWSPIDSVP